MGNGVSHMKSIGTLLILVFAKVVRLDNIDGITVNNLSAPC